jgi:hypothetical protein
MAITDRMAVRLGEEILGPLLLVMAEWVEAQARATGVERLYYLGRDGWLFHHAHRLVGMGSAIPRTDLLASRRCYGMAAIEDLDDEDYRWFGTGRPRRAVHTWFDRCQVPCRPAACREQGVTPETLLDLRCPRQNRILHRLFLAHADAFRTQAAAERAALQLYLRAHGLHDPGTIGLVDVGWRGTAQRNLVKILGIPGERIHGFYWGTHRRDPTAHGLWFGGEVSTTDPRCSPASVFLMDCLFAGEAPTLIRFIQTGTAVTPVQVRMADDAILADIMRPVQTAAMAWLERTGRGDLDRLLPQVSNRVSRLLLSPTTEEITWLQTIPYRQGMGDDPAREALIVLPRPRHRWCPFAWRRAWRASRWQLGLAALAPLPYRWALRGWARCRRQGD